MEFLQDNGVKYTGDIVNNEPHGIGEMEMENGKIYKGGFKNGQFHGDGELIFEQGKIIGKWHEGQLMTYEIFFKDGLEFKETKWDYITPDDRRFYNEKTGAVPVACSRENPNQYLTEEEMLQK